MLLKELSYVRPNSVEEAIELLNTYPDAGILAGGQSLINVLKMRIGAYSTLVDISALKELQQIRESMGFISLGAATTYDDIIHSPTIMLNRPILAETAIRIADQQVRNRGTIGGNCCYNDPTCHFPPLLTAMGATMLIAGKDKRSEMTAEEFFTGYYQTALEPGELLVDIRIPKPQRPYGDAFVPLSVGGTDVLNAVTVTAHLELNAEGKLTEVRLVAAGVGPRPLRMTAIEKVLDGQPYHLSDVASAVATFDISALEPPSDVHASGEYRRQMVPVLTERALKTALEQVGRGYRE
ncbi:MAG: hypothetical protein C7B46_04925 [Sulfobacillus benefaciens]|uniref:FAD-binding PCMH-type domain-containing protein n=1 Tax=Sulfobacillus benefaciens TaxID=453960 RepID=A0A2T2XJ45_9FIRM|nr:MAG: hypothetical protein C7B46_04925 [Sulfobacillus benefaciens]